MNRKKAEVNDSMTIDKRDRLTENRSEFVLIYVFAETLRGTVHESSKVDQSRVFYSSMASLHSHVLILIILKTGEGDLY